MRVCLACKTRVTPPKVLAPYERGDGRAVATRHVKSQRETDLGALALAGRQGELLAQLGQLTEDDKLDAASAKKVEWFAKQVETATTDQRLDELVMLFREAGIRRRRFWQGTPAGITDGYDDDGQDQADDDERVIRPGPIAAIEAAPAADPGSRAGMTWAEAITAASWRMNPATDGVCQIVDSGIRCEYTATHSVGAFHFGNGFTCNYHYGQLGIIIRNANSERSAR